MPDGRRNQARDSIQDDEISTAQAKPRMKIFLIHPSVIFFRLGQFQERVKQLMNREKSQLKAKGQRMPSHSELKKPEQIVKKRAEKRKRDSLQRARQARKGGRTNYRNKRQSNKPKHARRMPSKNADNPTKRNKKK